MADFSESTLQGDIRGIRVRGPDDDDYRSLPYTTYFSISNGEIVDGRFTASVSGVDSAENAPPDRTVTGIQWQHPRGVLRARSGGSRRRAESIPGI